METQYINYYKIMNFKKMQLYLINLGSIFSSFEALSIETFEPLFESLLTAPYV